MTKYTHEEIEAMLDAVPEMVVDSFGNIETKGGRIIGSPYQYNSGPWSTLFAAAPAIIRQLLEENLALSSQLLLNLEKINGYLERETDTQ